MYLICNLYTHVCEDVTIRLTDTAQTRGFMQDGDSHAELIWVGVVLGVEFLYFNAPKCS